MDYIIVQGGNKLKGTVKIEGAKNAALPILAATLLAEKGQTVLNNVPALSDVYIMVNILMNLNANVYFNHENNQVIVDATNDLNTEAPLKYVSQMRASIVVMGPLLARNGRAKVPMPGGCVIGKRPIDLHIKGLQALGATVFEKNGYIEAIADELKGAKICLDFPSVGATQNIMMAAVNAKGTTVIENAACEPEIVDLANILNKMGAKIKGMGTETIEIKGVEHLKAVKHTIIQDRIEAGTFMVAAAITGGNILIREAIEEHNITLISKLREMGVIIRKDENGIRVIGTKYLKKLDIETIPYPGFPTDMQAQMSVLLMLANGTSILTENIFENRFQHIAELIRMGAECKIIGNSAFIYGESQLCGTEVAATDLRAAAALILAGLAAKGETKVTNLEYLDRGYYDFHLKLQKLNGNIKRVYSNIPY